MPSDRSGAETARTECAFCDLASDYVLMVTDSAPDELSVIDDSLALPVCRSHFDEMEAGAI